MKRMIICILIYMCYASGAYAVATPSDEDYRSLDELRARLVRMRQEMDRFMKDVITAYPGQSAGINGFGSEVKVDIGQTDKDIVVKADMPGMDKDKIDITLENNRILKISGSREMAKNESSPGVVKQERMQGKFERVLELPADCLSEGISATYNNGVLEVLIPKKEEVKKEAVKIKVQ